ncbi:MAG: hypothetical protein AAB678_00845 [Patescibacteria group bacterium]
MANKTLKFKNDKFKKSRGGYSRWLLISCAKCKTSLLRYQKDGPGILKRLYLDRISDIEPKQKSNLVCNKCKTIIGVPIIYEKEKRRAFRLFVGAIIRKIIK